VLNETLRNAHRAATVATVATVVSATISSTDSGKATIVHPPTNSLLKRLDLFRQERDIDLAP
jgi:hypothetical protein